MFSWDSTQGIVRMIKHSPSWVSQEILFVTTPEVVCPEHDPDDHSFGFCQA